MVEKKISKRKKSFTTTNSLIALRVAISQLRKEIEGLKFDLMQNELKGKRTK